MTPWWETIRLRAEITEASGAIDDVQMSLFHAVYGTGREAAVRDPATTARSLTLATVHRPDGEGRSTARRRENSTAAPGLDDSTRGWAAANPTAS